MTWRPALFALGIGMTLLALTATIGQTVSAPYKVNLPLIDDASAPTASTSPSATTAPATATPPASTPTPTLVFSDDFSDDSSGWSSDSTVDYQVGYVGGEYQMEMISPNASYLASPRNLNPTLTEYGVSADMRYASTGLGVYGLVFDLASDGSAYYLFLVDPSDNQFGLFEQPAGGNLFPLVGFTSSSAILGGQTSNHLTIIRNGNTIQGLVNHTQVLSLQNTDIAPGAMGLYNTAEIAVPADARFDNFLVYSPGLQGQVRSLNRSIPIFRAGPSAKLFVRP